MARKSIDNLSTSIPQDQLTDMIRKKAYELYEKRGKKSGQDRVNPMMYLELEGAIYVFASNAGAPAHPDWFHNLLANPNVTIEVGTESFDVTAEPVSQSERDRIYALQVERYPGFGEYEQKTTRVIPVVKLVRK